MNDHLKNCSKDSEKMLYVQPGTVPLVLVRLGLASPEQILSFSYGQVSNSKTIDFKTNKSEDGGLFCCKIFGPIKKWECNCRKYTGYGNRGIVCDRCGAECNDPKVRYERMGHIELSTPIVHPWCLSWIADLLEIALEDLKRVVYYESYMVTNAGDTPLGERTLISATDYATLLLQYKNRFVGKNGSDAIRELLTRIDLNELYLNLEKESHENYQSKRLEVIQWFLKSNSSPEWTILEVIPVIPPMLRPLMHSAEENSPAFDINDQYRKVIDQNLRLKELINRNVGEELLISEKKKLQECVDRLFNNDRWGRTLDDSNLNSHVNFLDLFPASFNMFIKDFQGLGFDIKLFKH